MHFSLTCTRSSNLPRVNGQLTEKFVYGDNLDVSTFAPIAVLVSISVVIYKWPCGVKPIET